MKELNEKINKWREWCGSEDSQNDHIRDFVGQELEKGDLFKMLELVESAGTWQKPWTERLIMRLTKIRNRKPFLVRDGLDEFIRELEALV